MNFRTFSQAFLAQSSTGPLHGSPGLGSIVAFSAPQLSAAIVCSGYADVILICARKSPETPGACGAPEHAGEFIWDLICGKQER